MNDITINFSDAISKLLSDTNKDKSFGEVSEELNEYLVTIKEAVSSGELTYETLQEEISKHLDENDTTLPGSLAQLLIGCTGDKGACPMSANKQADIPFVYDNKYNKIFPLTKQQDNDNENTYAVLYFTGQPKNLNIDSLKFLEKAGFNKLKIEYKNINNNKYKTIYIENLKRYIYSQPEKNDDNIIYLIWLILLVIFFYLIIKN
jgi:hypothetical protein|tara:strand:+ start:218 stop:832 length:615 start_codon:yes stop_codon:yes gene_type:complete